MNIFSRFRPIALVVASALAASAAPAPDDLDRDERLAAGRLAFRDNCLMCHAEEMTVRSRLTEKQWATEVDKMAGWGAPVPPELKGPLLEYLVSTYSGPTAAPVGPPERIAFRTALSQVLPQGPLANAGDPKGGASLYSTHCATCHGPEARGGDLGTCLVEKTVLVRPADYSEVVRKGRRRMPGFAAALTPAQEADILAWLRSLRVEPPPLETPAH
jgi:ubiquinol-cytochrome c reductase cytochrome c subunit